jgi:NAD(P)-dependent dehydrogenase (short-subunit alcohol dehydrogenase family)
MAAPLDGQVALVAGATRGAGRGIARMLGEAGATVYCTGRSSRTQPNTTDHHYAGRPETIEETAELVTAAGGVGIPVRVDHNVERDVAALFARVRRERKRLDVLVNILTGRPVASWSAFWKQPLDGGRALVDSWIWPHIVTAWHAAPLMAKQRSGLIVEVVEQPGIQYHGQFFFDLMGVAEADCMRAGAGAARRHGAPLRRLRRTRRSRLRRDGDVARCDRAPEGEGLWVGGIRNAVFHRARCGSAGGRSERDGEGGGPVWIVGAGRRVRLR